MKSLSSLYLYSAASAAVTLIVEISLPIIAISKLLASAAQVGFLGAVCLGAPLVTGLSTGALIERYGVNVIVLSAGVIRCVVLFCAATFSFYFGPNIYILCMVGFMLSSTKLLDDTATIVALPLIIDKKYLLNANGRLEFLVSTAQIVAPMVCIFTLSLSSQTILFLAAISFLILMILFFKNIKVLNTETVRIDNSHLRSVARGFKWMWQYPLQRKIAISAAIFNLFHAMFFASFIFFSLRILAFTDASYSALLTIIGIFGALGAYASAFLFKRLEAKTILWASLFAIGPVGLPILLIVDSPSYVQFTISALCLGLWDFLLIAHVVTEITIRQRDVLPEHLPTIATTVRFFSWGTDPIGAILGGLFAQSGVGYSLTLAVPLIGMSLSAIPLTLSKERKGLLSTTI